MAIMKCRIEGGIKSAGGVTRYVHNGRCTNIERMGKFAWRSIHVGTRSPVVNY